MLVETAEDTQDSIFDITSDFVAYAREKDTAADILDLLLNVVMPIGLGQVISRVGNSLANEFAAAANFIRQTRQLVNDLTFDAFRVMEMVNAENPM